MLRPHLPNYPSVQVFPLGGGGVGSLELPGGNVIPAPVSAWFLAEHTHPGGFDLHPEFRPWARRRVATIIAVAPAQPIAPNILTDGIATRPFAGRTPPLNIAPQVPAGVTF